MKTIIAVAMMIASLSVSADWKMGVDLYGMSHHPDTPKYYKYNEKNWGIGAHATYTPKALERAEFSVGAGGWHNSFNDPAYYLQAKATYRLFHRVRAGYDIRTWASESYEPGIMVYSTVEMGLDKQDKFRVGVLHKSAWILFGKVDF